MDGHAQLRSLALAINGASDVDAAWAGSGAPVDLRKACGICGEDQPIRVPFLRQVCRSCAAIWVPGICGDCAHTSVTFTVDGLLSPYASCGCGGALRKVAYVPKPRAAVDPEVAAARRAAVEQAKKRATRTSRTVMVLLTTLAVAGTAQVVHRHNAAPRKADQPIVHRVENDPSRLSPTQRGRLAAAELTAQGLNHDVFACAARLHPTGAQPTTLPTTEPSTAPVGTVSPQNADAGSNEYLAACLAG